MTASLLLPRSLICCTLLALGGCSQNPHYVINEPGDQSSMDCTDAAGVACPVRLNVQWDGVSVRPHPEVELDGSPLAVNFSTVGSSSVATITTNLGQHTVKVSGDLSAKGTIATYSATSAFTVRPAVPPTPGTGSFGVSANPTGVLVERGKSATTTVTVTRVAPFAGAVTVALSNPPAGITSAPVSVAAGSTSGVMTISAGATAVNATSTVSLTGTAAGVSSASAPLKVTVGRETGAFLEANPSPYQSPLPSTRNALAGTFRVDISVGSPTVPQPRKANFFRGTTAVGGDIGFTVGTTSSLGGAGFCANSSPMAITRGVVMSGVLPGFASQNVFLILDVTANAPAIRQATADMTVQQTPTGPFITFQPRVFFSKDCTIALVAGANKLGPSKHILHVMDLISGQPLGSEVPFETAIFSALLRNSGSKQEIEIKVDTGAPSAQIKVIPLP
jgi:hypothetical protein